VQIKELKVYSVYTSFEALKVHYINSKGFMIFLLLLTLAQLS